MKKLIGFITMIAFAGNLFSQNIDNQSINGKVINEQNEPVTYATVILLNEKDSSVYKTTFADDKGSYKFQHIVSGKYVVKANSIGKEPQTTTPFNINGNTNSLEIPDIILKENAQQLKGVTVSAQKPLIEQKVDRMVVNVEGSIIATGNNVLEVLQKIPGVQVDQNDNISLKGKSGVLVMIDDKPTYLSADQLASMLRSMNSNQLSQIEVMTNPPAKYDAAGTAGIINIKLKKNANEGINGSINGGYSIGIHSQYNGGVNMNYKKGKVNVYANFNSYDGKNGRVFNLTRDFIDVTNGKPYLYMQQSNPNEHTYTYQGIKTGIDYDINDKQTLGFMFNGGYQTNKNIQAGPINFLDADRQQDSSVYSIAQNNQRWHSLTYELNYKWKIDTSGQELSAVADYSSFDSRTRQFLTTDFLDKTGAPNAPTQYQRGQLPSDISIKAVKIDYVLPLKGNAKFSAGLKSSFVTSDNNVVYDNSSDQINWVADISSNNHFIYKENINAAYLNFNKDFKKGWSLQAGLRGEQTISNADQVTSDSIVKRNYFQLFPTVFIRKNFNDNNSIGLSYSRRIDRPDYQDLNPFKYVIDQFTYGQGNSFLQPQFTNSFEINYTYKKYIATLNYSHTSDVISRVIVQDTVTHIGYETSENLSKQDNISLSFSIPLQVAKWWSSNNYLNIYYSKFIGIVNNAAYNLGNTSYNFNSQNTFNLPWNLKAELDGYYNAKALNTVWRSHPQYSVSAGLQKSLWDNKANIKLNVNDIFNTQSFTADLYYSDIQMHLHNKWESRKVALTFTYNFGNKNLKIHQHDDSGSSDEQNRISK